jgi:cleavage stimulation factor subunit 2
MWGGPAGAPQQGHYGQQQPGGVGAGAPSSNAPKHDIFVGNLAFNTTEEQLHQAFSELGRVLNVRMVTDVETGKPRGFAFVEFEDPQAALSAIRNMNDYELNGRRLRVNFSNSSHLEALAGKLGMDLSQQTQRSTPAAAPASSAGTSAVADALKGLNKGEMFDVIAKLKEIADRDPDEARRIISGHPQLPEALLFCMSKLEMVRTAVASESAVLPPPPIPVGLPPPVAPPSRPADPRARASAPRASDPRANANAAVVVAAPPPPPPRADPRARVAAADPRARQMQQQQQPPRPPPPPAYGLPPPPPQHAMPHLDPSLVQQVMALTPQQISELPPHKQQSILALRQQITGAGR